MEETSRVSNSVLEFLFSCCVRVQETFSFSTLSFFVVEKRGSISISSVFSIYGITDPAWFVTLYLKRYITSGNLLSSRNENSWRRQKRKTMWENFKNRTKKRYNVFFLLTMSDGFPVGDRFWEQEQVLRADFNIFRWSQQHKRHKIHGKEGTNATWRDTVRTIFCKK